MSLGDVDRRATLRAHAHPLRLQMLSLLTGAPMSAAELGRELGVSQALASYHLRCLVDAGVVQLVEEVVNRGGRERRYRYIADAAERTPPPSESERELVLVAAIDELRRRYAERDPSGRSLMIDAELWVSPEEWVAFREAVQQASLRLHNQAVRPRTPGATRVSVTTSMFEMNR